MRLVLFLIFASILCYAQEKNQNSKYRVRGYLGITQNLNSVKQFKLALEEYTEKRSWLESSPQLSNSVTGFIIGNGFFNGNSYYDLNIFFSNQGTKAKGFSNYGYSSRTFRIRNIGMAFDYLKTNSYLFNQIYIGGSLRYCYQSFYSLSDFNDNWRVDGGHFNLSPKIQYSPSFLKKRVFVDLQFNIPLNQINISDLEKYIGTKSTKSYVWPYSFEISLKTSIL